MKKYSLSLIILFTMLLNNLIAELQYPEDNFDLTGYTIYSDFICKSKQCEVNTMEAIINPSMDWDSSNFIQLDDKSYMNINFASLTSNKLFLKVDTDSCYDCYIRLTGLRSLV